MPLITLTTDFGIKDHFVGAIKGAIFSELPNINIVDISHEIAPFNIAETAYIVKNAYKSFPKGTIHIIGVDSELTKETKHIALLLDEHYFICPDNGVISMITTEFNPQQIVEINIHNHIASSFPVLDVFVQVACHIARGGTLDVIGKSLPEIKKIKDLQPLISTDRKKIVGSVIYIDNYGNVITNIDKKLFTQVQQGRKFEIRAKGHTFKTVYEKYSEIINFDIPAEKRYHEGEKLAIFNSAEFIELAIFKSNPKSVGSASTLLGLEYRDAITISFVDEEKPDFELADKI